MRNPISTTKRFIQRTVESLKSFLSGGGEEGCSYQRLPKTPPFNLVSCTRKARHMDIEPKMTLVEPAAVKEEKRATLNNICCSSSPLKAIRGNDSEGETRRTEETRDVKMLLLARQLKELKIVDKANMDHLLDIQELFHYYSRLSCPAYVHIVDAFFMDLYAQFLNSQQFSSS